MVVIPPRLEPGVCVVRVAVVVLAWGSWRAAMRARCGGGRLGLTGGGRDPSCVRKPDWWQCGRAAHTATSRAQLRSVGLARPPVGPSCTGRAGQATGNPSQTSVGPSCADVGGIATIGGSGRRVAGVSRAYGSNSPRLEPCRRRGSFDNEAQQSQFPRLEPGRHAPMRRRPRRSPRSAHCYVSETLPVHSQEWPYRACA